MGGIDLPEEAAAEGLLQGPRREGARRPARPAAPRGPRPPPLLRRAGGRRLAPRDANQPDPVLRGRGLLRRRALPARAGLVHPGGLTRSIQLLHLDQA